MQDEQDWRIRMENKVEKIDENLVEQRHMLLAMMQHLNIEYTPPGP